MRLLYTLNQGKWLRGSQRRRGGGEETEREDTHGEQPYLNAPHVGSRRGAERAVVKHGHAACPRLGHQQPQARRAIDLQRRLDGICVASGVTEGETDGKRKAKSHL